VFAGRFNTADCVIGHLPSGLSNALPDRPIPLPSAPGR
jgi:hypothetical protein